MAESTDVVAVTLSESMLALDKWDDYILNIIVLTQQRAALPEEFPWYPEFVGMHINKQNWSVTVYLQGVGQSAREYITSPNIFL